MVGTSALLKNQLSSCKQTQLEYIKDETKIDERQSHSSFHYRQADSFISGIVFIIKQIPNCLTSDETVGSSKSVKQFTYDKDLQK